MTKRLYKENTVLVVDDEPEYLEWLHDYLAARGLEVEIAESVAEAIQAANAAEYRLYLIDLNIPAGSWSPPSTLAVVYDQYKGLNVIRYLRNQSQAGKRIVAYSAHENEDIHAAIKNLFCQYVVKGRAKNIKVEIDSVLQHDPKANH